MNKKYWFLVGCQREVNVNEVYANKTKNRQTYLLYTITYELKHYINSSV